MTRHCLLFCRDRDLTQEEKDLIKGIATNENVVKHVWLLWELYMNSNTTAGISTSNMTDIEEFMKENEFFLESFDFIKDLAIENPGESSVIKLT